MKTSIKSLFLGILIAIYLPALALGDTYPKNTKIDVINYAFKIELSDSTDEIVGEAIVDVKFLADGITLLRLDLVNTTGGPDAKGMLVGIYYPGQTKPTIEKIQLDTKSKTFTISTTAEPEKLVLDPNTWVLMDAELKMEN